MNRYSAWARECLLFVQSHIVGFIGVAIMLEACIAVGHSLVSTFADHAGARVGLVDGMLMLVDPPAGLLSLPQVILGPLAILVILVQTQHDHAYNAEVRLGSAGLWAKKAFVACVVAVGVSFLYFVLLTVSSLERYAIFAESGGSSSLLHLFTGLLEFPFPSLLVAFCVTGVHCLVVVLFEVALFLLLYRITKNGFLGFASVVVLSMVALILLNFPSAFGSGYYFFATDDHRDLILVVGFSALVLGVPQIIYSSKRSRHDS